MEGQGLRSLFPMERLSVMGFVEPLKRLPELLRIRGAVYRHFRDNPPDLFLGIDSPDFNLRLERKLRRHGIRTAHLVSPSVWAWRRGRIHKIKRSVDLMLCLFPFETAIYAEHGVPVRFIGHPLADELPENVDRAAARRELAIESGDAVLALLPGSRGGEVRLLAPLFLAAARELQDRKPGLRLLLPAANAARRAEIETLMDDYPGLSLTLLDGQSREAMAAADAVLLASGTATLEAALLKRPMVVAYRMAPFSWWLITRLVSTEYAALPNVLAGRPVVPELLQDAATPPALAEAVLALLDQDHVAGAQLDTFADIHRQLRQDFAYRAAGALLELADG
jgi:lipid-A-disaccharide synthase